MSALLATEHLVVLPSECPPFRRRLGEDRLSELVRLFLLHEAVDAAALAPLDPAELPELLVGADSRVTAAVAIQPWRDHLFCHDWWEGSCRRTGRCSFAMRSPASAGRWSRGRRAPA